MKTKIHFTLGTVLLLSSILSAQPTLDFHGYLRAGVGQNVEGGAASNYGNGGDGHPAGRLGNETDSYVEIFLGSEVWNDGTNSFRIATLYSAGTDGSEYDQQGNSWQGIGGEGPSGGLNESFREIYAAGAFDGYGIWAGKRFYQRKDIHIQDFYYLNNSGYGAGVENVDTSYGIWSLALIQSAEDSQDDYSGGPQGDDWRRMNKVDLRLTDIPLAEKSSVDIALIYGFATLSDSQKESTTGGSTSENDGVLLSLEHSQSNLPGDGVHKVILQLGNGGFATLGSFKNNGGDILDAVDGTGWRLIDWGVVESGRINFGWSAIYARQDVDDVVEGFNDDLLGENEYYNLVVRPGFEWNSIMSTVLELGYANNKAEGGTWEDLGKITLAQQWQAGNTFWSRPALRLYVTHYMGDLVDAREAQGDAQNTMIGAQVESWW